MRLYLNETLIIVFLLKLVHGRSRIVPGESDHNPGFHCQCCIIDIYCAEAEMQDSLLLSYFLKKRHHFGTRLGNEPSTRRSHHRIRHQRHRHFRSRRATKNLLDILRGRTDTNFQDPTADETQENVTR